MKRAPLGILLAVAVGLLARCTPQPQLSWAGPTPTEPSAIVESVASLFAGVIVGTGVGWAQNFGVPQSELHFRLEWEAGHDRGGRPTVSGYIYNDYGLPAENVRLLVVGLDASGRPLTQTIGHIDYQVPAKGRAFFEVPVPTTAASYRVTVQYFNWRHGGPSGM